MKARFENGEPRVAPDTDTMSTLLDAILKTGDSSWAKKVLWEMVDDFDKGKSKCEPTSRMFETMLKSLGTSSHQDALDTAMEIIQGWMELNQQTKLSTKPRTYSYVLLVECWYVAAK